jgi:hypothetical protein
MVNWELWAPRLAKESASSQTLASGRARDLRPLGEVVLSAPTPQFILSRRSARGLSVFFGGVGTALAHHRG